MKPSRLVQVHAAAEEWARLHNIEATRIEVKPSGIGSNIHVLVVARRGFENWPRSERQDDLFHYLHEHANPDNELVITLALTMTEEEYDKHELTADAEP